MKPVHHSLGIVLFAAAALSVPAAAASVSFPTFNSSVELHSWRDDGAKGLAKIPAGERRTSYYWAAFTQPPSDSLLAKLDGLGAAIMGCANRYGDGIVYKIDVNGRYGEVVAQLQADPSFINLAPLAVEDKIDEALWNGDAFAYAEPCTGAIRAKVAMYHRVPRAVFESYAAGRVVTVESGDSVSKYFTVVATPEQLRNLAFIDAVEEIFVFPPKQPLSFYSRQLTGVNQLQTGYVVPVTAPSTGWLSGVPYTGDSIWLCMNEPGAFRHLDLCELLGRDTVLRSVGPLVKRRDATAARWGLDEHGTNMAGVAAGNGWGSAYDPLFGRDSLHWRGIAPKARIIPDFTNAGDVNNHSFTEDGAYYNAWSQYNDYLTSNHATNVEADFNNVSIYAAANNGYFRWYGTQVGYYSLLANAKNTTLVGATEKGRAVLANFSSPGPTRDGRLKPDIMAPGAGLLDAGWHIDIDSIALVNGGVKHAWRFGAGDPGWGDPATGGYNYGMSNVALTGGTMHFDATAGAYIASNTFFPQSTVISNAGDTLAIRWRATALVPTTPTLMRLALLWKRPGDADVKDARITTSITITGGWQEVRIPLAGATILNSNGGWVTGDTLQRLRFDISHLEGDVVSCFLDDSYAGPGWHGTSEASAHVSGIVALMLQKYRNEVLAPRNVGRGTKLTIHDNPLWNSSVRAILAHTATDMVDTVGISVGSVNPDFAASGHPGAPLFGVGPDWSTGYGLVNAVKALDYVDTLRFREDTIRQGQTKVWYCTVPSGTARLRVSLCWDDPYAANVALADALHKKLVNNLDLTVKNVSSGVTSLPWTIADSWMHGNAIPDSGLDSLITPQGILSHPAVRGVDTSNNLEVVDVDLPAAGTYQITVAGTSVAMKQSTKVGTYQDFSVVCDYPLRTTLAKIAATVIAAPPEAPAVSLPPLQQPATPPGGLGKLSSAPGSSGTTDLGTIAAGTIDETGDPFPQWLYTAVITVNTAAPGSAVAEAVANLPLPVLLTNKNFGFAQAQATGGDLRFCDADGVPLSYWIESWNAQERKGLVWVLVPKVAANFRNNQVVMYWGNQSAAAGSDRNAVFGPAAGFAAFISNAGTTGAAHNALTLSSVNTLATSLHANSPRQFCLSWRTAQGNRMAIAANGAPLAYFRNGTAADRADVFDASKFVDDIIVSSNSRTASWIRLLQYCMADDQRIVEIR